mmetsp:Transcript_3806/g.5825  ORF Transcript_3806/g.5825 Transcript_3806/m.5825 type:complete len:147 (+) Transcript_3806:327-767(+)
MTMQNYFKSAFLDKSTFRYQKHNACPYYVQNTATELFQLPYSFLVGSNVTRCAEGEEHPPKHPTTPIQQMQKQLHPKDEDENCNVCLYTGVATCTGLTLYFWKMGILDMPERSSSKFTLEVARQQRFLVTFGGAWALAGAYRLYLG